jgi:hypothetical protein
MNLLATWASGVEFCRCEGFQRYIKSLEKIQDADIYIFSHEMPEDVREDLISRGIHIHDVDPKRIHFLVRDRYLIYREFLQETEYTNAIFTDSKDVLFHANPFVLDFKKKVFLISEGMAHKNSPWNMMDQMKSQCNVKQFVRDCENDSVINAGIFLGNVEKLKELFLLLWTNTVRANNCTEQAILNYLYPYLQKDPNYVLLEPSDSNVCVTGEAIKQGFFNPIIEPGVVLNPISKLPYYIFHQWERLPIEMLETYLEKE